MARHPTATAAFHTSFNSATLRRHVSGCNSRHAGFCSIRSRSCQRVLDRRRVGRTLWSARSLNSLVPAISSATGGHRRGRETLIGLPTPNACKGPRAPQRGGLMRLLSHSGIKWPSFTARLQHEKSNNIALNCATTKRHTVVCRLYETRGRLFTSLYPARAAFRARH
jgi:hypothetical protein